MSSIDFSQIEMVSFDCYGTLIDWERGILGALSPLYARHGIVARDGEILAAYAEEEARVEAGAYRRYREVLRATLAAMAARAGFTPAPGEADLLAESLPGWEPFPDTIPSLGRLRRRYRLAVLSNIDRELFAATSRRLGDPFDLVVTAEDAGSYKPRTGNFRLLLERSRISPMRLMHVAESRYHDVVPASSLGLRTVWVNRRGDQAGSGATPAVEARADLEVQTLAALADLCYGVGNPGEGTRPSAAGED